MSALSLLQLRARMVRHYAAGLIALRRSDVWLATFPKTGSTWLRTILANLAYPERDGEIDIAVLDGVMPSLGGSRLSGPWPHEPLPRFVKTHQPYRRGLFVTPRRAVLLIRDPREAAVSYFEMLSARRLVRFEGTLSDLVQHPRLGVEGFLQHYDSWIRRSPLVVRYEALRADTAAEVDRLFRALGAPVDRPAIEAAIERSTVERMRRAEASGGIANASRFDDSFQFVRAATGGWRERFTPADHAFYADACQRHGFHLYP